MDEGLSGRESPKQHIAKAIFANLLASLISAVAYVLVVNLYDKPGSDQQVSKLLASFCAVAFWSVSYGLLVLLVRHGKPVRENLKYIGYYFPLTAPFFWARDEQMLRHKAEEGLRTEEQRRETSERKLEAAEQELQRTEQILKKTEERLRGLERIIDGWPDVRIIAGIIDPEKRKDTLTEILQSIDDMKDHKLAQIVDNMRECANTVIGAVGPNGNYDLFKLVVGKVSQSEPDTRPETYTHFLRLLSDVFRMPSNTHFTRQVQKDMIGYLKNAIAHVDREHLHRVGTIVEQIMADEEDEHDLALPILEMLVSLDWKMRREVCQIIFDESKKRAFRFPQGFGFDFLRVLKELEHKVFWLDIRSLQDILEDAIKNGELGLINLKRTAYDELCAKVFAPLEDKDNAGIHNCRVFRRLKGKGGNVDIECVFSDATDCNCKAQSLGFRGFYSKKCSRCVNDKMKAAIKIPIMEIGKPKREFLFEASVAKLHPGEDSCKSAGRGIFLEQGEETEVKEFFEYVSSHKD